MSAADDLLRLAAARFDRHRSRAASAAARARLWRGGAPATGAATFDEAFLPPPKTWGFRGDPHLWEALRERLAGAAIPADDVETAAVLHDAIRELIGYDLREADGSVGVPAFAVGSGMSDGHVAPDYWLERGIPLLVRRAGDLRRGGDRPVSPRPGEAPRGP